MKNRLLTLAGTLALIAVLGKFYATPLMAQVRAALVQDVDQPARAPFQVTVPININNFTFTNVPIPAGHRLVIDMISMSGAAQTAGQDLQPIVLFSNTVAGSNSTIYMPGIQSSTVPGQYYSNQPVTMYSDSLSLAPAYAGFTPTFFSFNVTITGHLISLP